MRCDRRLCLATAVCLVLSCGAAGVEGKGPGSAAGEDGPEYVSVPPGTFEMGCVASDAECDTRETPRHAVSIPRGFWLGRTEVTVDAYHRFARATGRPVPAAPDFNPEWTLRDHPMVRVGWQDAAAYCAWVGGRLPTEAEWEYAARAGRSTRYPWGDTARRDRANYGRNTCCGGMAEGPDRWTSTAPVGSFPPNALGLRDVSGNVWEWCADAYRADAYAPRASGPPTPETPPATHVIRGGSWSSDPWLLRLSYRVEGRRDAEAGYDAGFRCARDTDPSRDRGRGR